jgi:S1-C subfamily serine protease
MTNRVWSFLSRSSLACALIVVMGITSIMVAAGHLEKAAGNTSQIQASSIDWSKAADSTVAIMDARGGIRGTGFFISKNGDTITAAHVIRSIAKEKQSIFVRMRGHHEMHRITVVAINDDLDIAVLKTGIKTDDFFKLSESDSLNVGDKLYVIGHPYGVPWQASEGLFSRQDIVGGRNILWVSVWIERGCSGGPLMNSKGEVVGMVSGFYNYFAPLAAHTNICVTGTDILRLLQAVRRS